MADQHGAASTAQIRAGMPWHRQRTLITQQAWRRDAPRVVTSRSAPATWEQRVMVATLATRGVASHGTAARLHHLDGFSRFGDIHVTQRYNQRRHAHEGSIVHISRVIDAHDQLPVQGIPTVCVPVCLLQLAERSVEQMSKALDGAMRDGISAAWIRQVATRHHRRGLRGPMRLLRAVDERVDGVLPLSWFQRLARQLLIEAGIETVDEHPVLDGDRLLATLDLAMPAFRVGIECQSWQWHATPQAQRRDALRKRALRRLGWEIIDLWWSDLHRIDDVVATIRVVIADRQHLQL